MGNRGEDLLAAQGLQLKPGGGGQAWAATEGTRWPGGPSTGGVGGPLHSGSRCFLLLGREERQEELAPHLQRGKLAQANQQFPEVAVP